MDGILLRDLTGYVLKINPKRKHSIYAIRSLKQRLSSTSKLYPSLAPRGYSRK